MWKKISASPKALGLLAGLGAVLAFPPIHITSALIFCPFFLLLSIDKSETHREAFWAGFLTSLAIMAGGFYWVIYVLNVFGHLPWAVATLVYLLFCGFGALCFPFFSCTLFYFHRRWPALKEKASWYVVGIPSLFVVFEFFVPKLFPWYVGHAFYRSHWLNQIVEFTGSIFLTFLIFSWGGLAMLWCRRRADGILFLKSHPVWITPLVLTLLSVSFSLWRLAVPLSDSKPLRLALIQANIGSLEKVEARRGLRNKVQYIYERYVELTERALQDPHKPRLILWPETAMPFSLIGFSGWAMSVRREVSRWNVPLITGGYMPDADQPYRDYNAAFLLEPEAGGGMHTDIYRKNILLAFGEYFPGGEIYPGIYTLIPSVSNFVHGKDQKIFTLEDGTRLGVTICYEDIVPRFYRKVARQGVNAVINLTNDSWFGPTSEPFQHAALAVFRAIETRTPFARVTNTGISFATDRLGRMSETTRVYAEGTLNVDIDMPFEPVKTVYLRFGDWFIGLVLLILVILLRSVATKSGKRLAL